MQSRKARILPVVLSDRARGKIGRRERDFLPSACLSLASFRWKTSRFSKSNTARTMPGRRSPNSTSSFIRRAGWQKRFVIRLNRSLSNEALADLNNHFRDIPRAGEIVQRIAPGKENDGFETLDLPRRNA